LKLSSRSSKSHGPSDYGGTARGLTRRCMEKSGCHCISTYWGWRVQELHALRDREWRSPDLIGAIDCDADRWHKYGESWNRHLGFSTTECLYRGLWIHEIQRVDHLLSGIRGRSLKLHEECTQGSRDRETRFPEIVSGGSVVCPVGDGRPRYGIGGASKLFGPRLVKVLVEQPSTEGRVASEWYQSGRLEFSLFG
jgi:hypothetical protein